MLEALLGKADEVVEALRSKDRQRCVCEPYYSVPQAIAQQAKACGQVPNWVECYRSFFAALMTVNSRP